MVNSLVLDARRGMMLLDSFAVKGASIRACCCCRCEHMLVVKLLCFLLLLLLLFAPSPAGRLR